MLTGESVLRRAAFGDTPGLDDRALTAVTGPRQRWLAAVVLGARGRYAAATTLLEQLRRGRDPLLASLASATLASHRRQLGGHAAALPLDAAALRPAFAAAGPSDDDGFDPAGARADALLGLAADNLGQGRLTAARRFIAAAAGHVDSWRTAVRAGWVGAEVELASGDAAAAVPHAERALARARQRGAVRHVVKSSLVLGAALAATGEVAARERAARLVGDAVAATDEHRLGSLGWPAGLLAAELDPAHADWNRSRVTRELYALLPASDPEGRRLARTSPWVPI
ncbi:hypothetical protein [Prauserella cavernicola]|uniref:Uncharacterized protein n=1 Tax=Prauserella cavernicola TaxID=2800127 RepID=A0A934R0B1_9PSEU|nr:hypothetical protein [Prauserella cavernicola]MBK1789347.1 hypothetical protein [Prauserella cavernicola]